MEQQTDPALPLSWKDVLKTAGWVAVLGLAATAAISNEMNRQRNNDQVRKTCPDAAIKSRLALAKPHSLVLSCSRPATSLPSP